MPSAEWHERQRNERSYDGKRQDRSIQSKFEEYSDLLVEWNLACLTAMQSAIQANNKDDARFWRAMII